MDVAAGAFLTLVNPHHQRLCALARQFANSPDDAAELVQETFLRAWRSFSPNKEAQYSRAWLVVILRNIAAEWHRSATRRLRLVPCDHLELTEAAAVGLSEPFSPLPTMNEAQFYEFLDDRIVAALDALEPAHREVVVLSVAGGLNYREIGEVLDCPIGTVMSRMARARRALRERLADSALSQRYSRRGRG